MKTTVTDSVVEGGNCTHTTIVCSWVKDSDIARASIVHSTVCCGFSLEEDYLVDMVKCGKNVHHEKNTLPGEQPGMHPSRSAPPTTTYTQSSTTSTAGVGTEHPPANDGLSKDTLSSIRAKDAMSNDWEDLALEDKDAGTCDDDWTEIGEQDQGTTSSTVTGDSTDSDSVNSQGRQNVLEEARFSPNINVDGHPISRERSTLVFSNIHVGDHSRFFAGINNGGTVNFGHGQESWTHNDFFN